MADPKLGNLIKEKLDIPCVHSQGVMELLRGVRQQMAELVSHLASSEVSPMALGLSHSLSRYKLKFSPDKVDTMIVQAIGLLDDLDKVRPSRVGDLEQPRDSCWCPKTTPCRVSEHPARRVDIPRKGGRVAPSFHYSGLTRSRVVGEWRW